MADYVIGDIQGCYRDLQNLLEQISYQPESDRLFFLGDIVNRGPNSLQVLRFIKSLPRCRTVLGNHDLHLICRYLGVAKGSRHDTLDEILKAPDVEELIHWLRHQALLIHLEELCAVLVHAGISPQWDLHTAKTCAREAERALQDEDNEFFSVLYGDHPDHWQEDLPPWDRLRYIVNCFTRLRFCDSGGHLVLSKKAAPDRHKDLKAWYQICQIQEDIIFGHWSTLGFHQESNIHCIDSGCLWGGRLTALRLDVRPFTVHQRDCPSHKKPIGL